MKYEKDMNGQFKEIFTKLEDIILSFPNIKRKKNVHQTSYYDEYKTVVMLRSGCGDKYFTSSWGNGIKLQEKYGIFTGDGKIVRHINFANINEIDENEIRNIIKESMVLNMEYYELQELIKLNKKDKKC